MIAMMKSVTMTTGPHWLVFKVTKRGETRVSAVEVVGWVVVDWHDEESGHIGQQSIEPLIMTMPHVGRPALAVDYVRQEGIEFVSIERAASAQKALRAVKDREAAAEAKREKAAREISAVLDGEGVRS